MSTDSGMDLENLQSVEGRLTQTCVGVMSVLSDFIRRFNPFVLPPMCPLSQSMVPRPKPEDLWLQVKELVGSMKTNLQLDFENDWKLITVFLSPQDACLPCSSNQQVDPHARNVEEIQKVLDFLHKEVPKAFVNLVANPEFGGLSLPHRETEVSTPPREPCACSKKPSRLERAVMRWSHQNYWEKLLASGRYDTEDSFTVVLQPIFHDKDSSLFPGKQVHEDSTLNWNDNSEFAALALDLWNVMMEEVGQKEEPNHGQGGHSAKCPTEDHPYFFTYRNTNYSPVIKLQSRKKAEEREGAEVLCPDKTPSATVPTSVHRLKPADIKVIAALGDSLTAANGAGSRASDILDVLTQYRGLSWSVGGNENISTVTTLANILREFNPSLQGFSIGTGKQTSPGAFLNQAVAGDLAEDLPAQARRLVDLMKNSFKFNFQEDWKIITIFIGGNDLCDFCSDPVHYSPGNFTRNIEKALDILHAEVPRAFVNLVPVLEIVSLRKLYQEKKVFCPRLLLRSLCPCVVKFADNSTEIASLILLNKRYQEGTHQLIDSGKYDTREDFTVVIQPFLEKVSMPMTPEGLPDSSFFAPDCFHFHKKAHGRAASGLWNNMLEPLGKKKTEQNFEKLINITCPTQARPFLSTYRNSNYTYPNHFSSTPPPPTSTPADQGHGSQLQCEDKAPSASLPKSVHTLKPADVKVVAAIGDSLTAGTGICSKAGDLENITTQYRGLSYSAGGDATLGSVTTLPNILREFNGDLTGYAIGVGEASDHNAFLNQAVPGAKAEGLLSQVQALVQRMKDDPRVSFQRDWKIITVLIGIHDLCDYCTDSNLYSATNFVGHLQAALDMLHREVPRALVNLVEVRNLTLLRRVFLDDRVNCPIQLASYLCNCVLTVREGSPELARIEEVTRAYQSGTRRLVESGRYDTREDFTVVLQPFFQDIKLAFLPDGRPDISFFAPNCFHPSQKFHSQLSRALWNNMLQPLGRKTDSLDLAADVPLSCPTVSEPFLATYKNSNYTYPPGPPIQNWGSDLLCPERSPSSQIPTSVHKLRPADIKVVAALGDSLTTAVGACASNFSDLTTAWRGLSWSIGGDGTLETHTTLPNILKKFNPQIYGYSIGTEEGTAGFNVAVGGAKAQDMPVQARALVERMKHSLEVNLEQDWKLITLFVGGNDLCVYCKDEDTHSVEKYVQHLEQALDILSELPRVFVSVVEIMEMVGLRQIHGEKCLVPVQNFCPCFLLPQENSPELQEMKNVNRAFQSSSILMAFSQKYMQREDFAVVLQPFFQSTHIPLDNKGDADLSFFSVDCFHFSERGYSEMAIALWNNMLEPVGQKQIYNNFTYSRTKLKCPSEDHPYLFTLRNSGLPGIHFKGQQNSPWEVPFWTVLVAAVGSLTVGAGIAVLWKSRKLPSRGSDTPAGAMVTAF
ncbi:phospholipase B1, membrane-associated [Ornithorhynchus anatinus]|uniref:phospholipase B1, membrane-associated n=1 Tax=Ornithorhynchus anatinus TaxID=9258 RepID=UPI0019D43A8A|nr:phospholipase B1, membrane-associated [Ornithorhynchus anatinus]